MTLCLAQSLVDTNGVFVARDQIKKYIAWYEDGYMSATGKCFDIGMATRTALTIWRDFFNAGRGREEKGNKKKKQNKVKGDEGVNDEDAHLAGQVLIDRALKHEVCPVSPLPPLRQRKGLFEKKILQNGFCYTDKLKRSFLFLKKKTFLLRRSNVATGPSCDSPRSP